MTYEEVFKELKQKIYKPIYFLQGEESYFIDKISDYISHNVLDESERDFNQTVVYGRDTSIQDIVNMAKRYPMMSEYQVVIVKEAQDLSRSIESLSSYLEQIMPSTILVFNYKYKKLDGRKALGKELKKKGYLFTSDKVKDYKLPDWIISYCTSEHLSINPRTAHILSEYLGNDLNKIANTLEKLKVVMDGDTEVTEELIQKNVGISKEYNTFELNNALGVKDVYKANLIANHFGQNPKNYPLVVTLGVVYGYFTKLIKYHQYQGQVDDRALAQKMGVHPFILKEYQKAARNYSMNKIARIFGYLRQYDLASKGVDNASTSDGELLKELVYKILH